MDRKLRKEMDVVAIKNNIFIEKELMDDVMSLDNENLIEENKKLKHEKNHFTLGFQKKASRVNTYKVNYS